MHMVIISFPPIKAGMDSEFQKWFKWSNEGYSKEKGYISRRLLKPMKEGNYAAVVEHESHETFSRMHSGPFHDEASQKVRPMFEGRPSAQFYDVVVG